MTALAFPVVGFILVFVVVVPAATLMARGLLELIRRNQSPWRGGAGGYLLVVMPTFAPLIWFVSGALHQAEPGASSAACLLSHTTASSCHDALLLAGALLVAIAYSTISRIRRHRRAAPNLSASSMTLRRLRRICLGHPDLAQHFGRLRLVGDVADPLCCTRGLLRPWIEIAAPLAEQLDDAELEAALLHELGHVEGRDPLRYFLSSAALALNPLAQLLRTDLRSWRFGREVACDRFAVTRGASALGLAQAIVLAASGRVANVPHIPTLSGAELERVKHRVELLLQYAGDSPTSVRRWVPGRALAVGFFVLLFTLPHSWGAPHLDGLHRSIEEAAALSFED